jgi:hypothetical protein
MKNMILAALLGSIADARTKLNLGLAQLSSSSQIEAEAQDDLIL